MQFYRTWFAAAATALSICCMPEVRAGGEITPLPVAEEISGWRFTNGPEFPGASGSMKFTRDVMILTGDFSRGGSYVAVERNIPESLYYQELRFRIKSPARRIAVRFNEANGQTHQHFIPLNGKTEEFQEIAVPVSGSPQHHWGGPNDGKLSTPVRRVSIVSHHTDSDQKQFQTELSGIRLIERENAPRGKVTFRPVAPEKLFLAPGGKEKIELQLAKQYRFSPDELKYVYLGYDGREVASGSGSFDERKRILSAPAPAGTGMYELHFPALKLTAGVVVDEPLRGAPDEYFAIDSSFSWGGHPTEIIRSYCRILKANGIVWNRDRLALTTLEPSPGNFQLNNSFGLYRKIAAEEGIKTLECFHDTPGWNGYTPKEGKLEVNWGNLEYGLSLYPLDLQAAARSLCALSSYWSDTTGAMEVWNEPDIGFGNNFPAEYQTAFTKAVSRRLAEQGSRLPVIGGVFTNPHAFTNYYASHIRNGMLDDVDAISYHTYSCWGTDTGADFKRIEETVVKIRETELALAPRRAGIPYWVTEAGSPWRRGDNLERATLRDDLRSASEFAALTAEFRALGFERFVAFEFGFYGEHHNNFGMMDRNFTPLRSMASYLHSIRKLGHKRYIGDLRIPGAVRSRTFSDGKTAVTLVYTGMLEDRTGELALPRGLKPESVTGLDGRPLEIRAGKLPMKNGAVYLTMPLRNARAFLNADTPAMKVYNLAKNFRHAPRKALPVVFQPADELRAKVYNRYGYTVTAGEKFPVSLRINNFSSEPLTIEPALRLPEHIRAEGMNYGKITIPPRSFVPFSFILIADSGLSQKKYVPVRLEDRSGRATPISWELKRAKDVQTAVSRPLNQDAEQGEVSWNAAGKGWTELAGWKPWLNSPQKQNIKAKFRIFHSPEKLQLQILVKDAVHFCAYPIYDAWNGDSIQFAFQRRGGRGEIIPAEPFHEFTAAECSDGERLYRHHPAPAQLSGGTVRLRQLAADEWLYVIELPAPELGIPKFAPGLRFGFSLLANSNNGGSRDGYLHWGGGIAESKVPAEFNQITLGK